MCVATLLAVLDGVEDVMERKLVVFLRLGNLTLKKHQA